MNNFLTIDDLFNLDTSVSTTFYAPKYFTNNAVFLLQQPENINDYTVYDSAEIILIIDNLKTELNIYFGEESFLWRQFSTYYFSHHDYMPYDIVDNLITNKICFFNTLEEALDNIHNFTHRHTFYVKEPWQKTSQTMVCYINHDDTVSGEPENIGFSYFLENSIILDWLDNDRNISKKQFVKEIIHYAKYDG